jgi:hypothetical protein
MRQERAVAAVRGGTYGGELRRADDIELVDNFGENVYKMGRVKSRVEVKEGHPYGLA